MTVLTYQFNRNIRRVQPLATDIENGTFEDQNLPLLQIETVEGEGATDVASPGYYIFCKGTGDKNHYSMTKSALQSLVDASQIGSEQLYWIAKGTVQIDFYLFHKHVAHAQSESLEKKDTCKTEFCETWMPGLLSDIQRFAESQPNFSAYLLGYFCHGLQDLVSHYGITNPIHRNLDRKKKSPDDTFDRELCVRLTTYAVEFLLHSEPHQNLAGCLKQPTTTGLRSISDEEKTTYRNRKQLLENLSTGVLTFWNETGQNVTPEDIERVRWWNPPWLAGKPLGHSIPKDLLALCEQIFEKARCGSFSDFVQAKERNG